MAISDNRIKNQKIKKFTHKSLAFFSKHLLILSFLIALVFVQSFRHNARVSSFFVEVSGSVYSTSDKITGAVKNIFSELKFLFSNLASLQDKNIKLQDEIIQLKNQLNELQIIQNQNAELKKLLNYVSSIKVDYVSSRLLSIIKTAEGDYGIIESGKNSLIDVNDLVVCEDGVVGKVYKVSDNYSTVLLITNSKFRIPIMTLSGQRGMFIGDVDKPHILYIRDASQIQKQELIVTTGEGYSVISDIFVARVDEISPEENKLKVHINTNPNNVRFVSVLKVRH